MSTRPECSMIMSLSSRGEPIPHKMIEDLLMHYVESKKRHQVTTNKIRREVVRAKSEAKSTIVYREVVRFVQPEVKETCNQCEGAVTRLTKELHNLRDRIASLSSEVEAKEVEVRCEGIKDIQYITNLFDEKYARLEKECGNLRRLLDRRLTA